MVKTREVVSWHQMEKDQNQNIQDWSVVAFENKTRHLHVRTTCWPEQCPMIELQGKDRIWQTLCKTMTSSYTDTKRNYPFPFVDELWIPMQPFPNPCGSWFEKTWTNYTTWIQNLSNSGCYKYHSLFNFPPSQRVWHLWEKKLNRSFVSNLMDIS